MRKHASKTIKKNQVVGVIIFCLMALLPLACGGSSGTSNAASGVTIANLAGTWNFTFVGALGGCAQSSFGTLTFDSNGNVVGSEFVHSSCGDGNLSFTGIATVNSVGTGTLNITPSQNPPLTFTFQVSNSQTEIFFADVQDTGTFLSGVAFKQ
jgi:hypothetical protein